MKSIALRFLIFLLSDAAIMANAPVIPVPSFDNATPSTEKKYLFSNFDSEQANAIVIAPPTVLVGFSNPTTVNQQGTMTLTLTNGAGASPVNIVVNPAACNENAGILGY
ncbi:MAG: hypothetical protein RIS64_1018 [Bacteroidota bacterium]